MSEEKMKRILNELKNHAPFTSFGAFTGIIIIVIILLGNAPSGVSYNVFYVLHPLHVLLSALVTTAMYRKYSKSKIWVCILIGYFGSVGIATLSDIVIPYIGGSLLNIPIEFELGFIEKWWLVNPLAFAGIVIGYLKPKTKIPHSGHVLLSTWASLFYLTAFGTFGANWIPLIPFVFLFLFLAVWIPCCVSDIVFPLLFVKEN